MAKKKSAFPKEILVYVYDDADGTKLLTIAENVEDIPEDCSGGEVGVYTLNHISTFAVKRSLE